MYTSIILPLNLEESGDRPVGLVRRLAALAGLPIELVTVSSPAIEHHLGGGQLERRRRRFPRADCTVTLLHGKDAANTIVSHLAERPDSLVALATSARGPVGEKVFGSVSEVVLASRVAPILLFGPEYLPSAGTEPPTLVVAVDRTEESEVVLSAAAQWAATFGGASRLVEVVPTSTDDQERRRVGEHLARRIQCLAPDAICEVVDGHRPARALLRYGHRLDDVVMAMASCHWTDERSHLHSVTRAVTHRSHFPVLVVPQALDSPGCESRVRNGDAASPWQPRRH